MKSLTVQELICKVTEVFGRFGIPEVIVADAGTQFSSFEWMEFAKENGIVVKLASPLHQQTNRLAERMIKTVKQMLATNLIEGLDIALLNYHSTLNASGKSPAELLMGHRLRTRLPEMCGPTDPGRILTWKENYRRDMKCQYDHRHAVVQKENLDLGHKSFHSQPQEIRYYS